MKGSVKNMIFNRSEILFEAENAASMTKIGVLSDMMFENYLFEYEFAEDEDTYVESASGMIQTAKKMVSTMIAKIKEFLDAKRQAFNEYIRKRNLRKLMSSDFRALLKKLEKHQLDKKYTTPDVLALKKISEKYADLIEKYVAEIEKQISNLPRKGFGKEKIFNEQVKKINRYIMNMKSAVNALEKEAENVRIVVLTPEMIYKYVEAGIRSEDDIVEIQHTVANMEKKFNDIVEMLKKEFQTEMESNAIYLRKKKREAQRQKTMDDKEKNAAHMKEVIKESAEEDRSTGGFFGKIKSLISKAITGVNAFVHSHARLLSKICRVLSVIYGFATASRVAGTLTMGGLTAAMANDSIKSEVLRKNPNINLNDYDDGVGLMNGLTAVNAMKAGGDAIASVALGKASKKLKKIAKEEEQRKNEEI